LYNIMGQDESGSLIPVQQSFTELGKVWTQLYAKCSEYLNPEQCKTILGYRPVIIPVDNNNPLGIKWYWFLAAGYGLARILRI